MKLASSNDNISLGIYNIDFFIDLDTKNNNIEVINRKASEAFNSIPAHFDVRNCQTL